MKHLLIVFHSQTGHTRSLMEAVVRGAAHPDVDIEVRVITSLEAGLDDLLWADGVILGTPENFGYMSGAMKNFLDRTYYPAQGKVEGLPFALFVSAGNDGRGAVSSIRRIARGYPLKEVQEPLIVRGEPQPADLALCEEMGLSMAAGIEAGIF
jgi:multimeric flavodoxin WrbA